MFTFLRRAIPYRRHIIHAFSPSTFQLQLLLQTQWSSARYANSNASNGNSFTVSYLIDSCGFSPQKAEAASKRVSLETRYKPDLVIEFLKSHGFSQPQILRLIRNGPELLRFDPEKIFLPKIEFFKSRGISSSLIPRFINDSPNIMRRSLTILIDPKTSIVPKMELLREAGVPQSNIIKYLQFFSRTLTCSRGRVKKAVEEVKELGFDPLTFQFLVAVHVCISLKKSTRDKKADVYKKWGCSDNDIVAAFRKFPVCMTLSEDHIDAKLEFFVNQLGCNPSSIIKYPNVLGYSLKKRIVPRAAVLQVLLSKGLMKSKTFILKFMLTEKDFLRRVVLCHGQEVANELLDLYRTKLGQAE
ncbi:hypothetical protein K1719_042172 [Acacia pycnantha]|nr:hypothetical protein K1719_042172 [Acacia pycnantha]